MKKKEVSKLTYISWNVIYYALCVSGLIWQVVQISVNFFDFDVVKDINVIMPDEMKYQDRVLYICFDNDEVFYHEKYVKKLYEKYSNREVPRRWIQQIDYWKTKCDLTRMLTIKERFQLSNEKIFSGHGRDFKAFIIGKRMCLQSRDAYWIWQSQLQNVTAIYVSLGKKLPYFDYRRSMSIKNLKKENMTIVIGIISSSFIVKKLKKPYKDKCIDYTQQNYVDQIDAKTSCMDAKMMELYNGSYVSDNRLITKSNYKFYNYRIKYDYINECESKLNHSDCIHHYYLTEVKPPAFIDLDEPIVMLAIENDTSVSFNIVSKPRIDNIDYVTYILGALGSWIGFSFIGINPIPLFLTMKSKAINTTENHTYQNDEKFDNIAKDNAILKRQITFLKYRVHSMITQHDNRLKSLEKNTNVNE